MKRLLHVFARMDTGIAAIISYLATLGLLLAYPPAGSLTLPFAAHGVSSLFLALAIAACLAERYRDPQTVTPVANPGRQLQRLGSVLFHLSLVLILPVGYLDRLLTCEGDMILTRNIPVSENHSNYVYIHEGPLFLENHGNFQVELTGYLTRVKSGETLDAAAHLRFGGKDSPEAWRVTPNSPAWYQGWKFTLKDWGPTIHLQSQTTTRRAVMDNRINLDLLYDRTDSVRVSDFDMTLTFRLQPPPQGHDYMIAPRRNDLEKAIFHLDIQQGTREIFQGTISRGQVISARGLQFRITEISYWNRFHVARYPMLPILYSLMALALLGLTMTATAPWLQGSHSEHGDDHDALT